MKKRLLALLLAGALALSLAACGGGDDAPAADTPDPAPAADAADPAPADDTAPAGDEAPPLELTQRIAHGLSIPLPDSFGDFEEVQDGMSMTQGEEGMVIVSAPQDAQGNVPADWSQEYYMQTYTPAGSTDVKVQAYSNETTCAGLPAVVAMYDFVNPQGEAMTFVSIIPFHEDGTLQIINLSYLTNEQADGVFAQSLSVIADNITLA